MKNETLKRRLNEDRVPDQRIAKKLEKKHLRSYHFVRAFKRMKQECKLLLVKRD